MRSQRRAASPNRKGFRGVVLAFLCLFSFILVSMTPGCGPNGELSAPARARKAARSRTTRVSSEPLPEVPSFRVKVALYGPPDEFTKQLRRGLEAAAEANHLALSEAETKERLSPPIAMPAQEKTDAMIVCAVDAAQAQAAVKQANSAQVPVFTALFPAASGAVVAHITDARPDARRKVSERSARSARPEEIGWKTIETVAAYLRGEKVPPVISIEAEPAGGSRSDNSDGGSEGRYHGILPAAPGVGDSPRRR